MNRHRWLNPHDLESCPVPVIGTDASIWSDTEPLVSVGQKRPVEEELENDDERSKKAKLEVTWSHCGIEVIPLPR